MPKDTIKSCDEGSIELHVGWSKGQRSVDVAVLWVDPDDDSDYPNGWYAKLDREGINRAIRALRAARDQAYGKDA